MPNTPGPWFAGTRDSHGKRTVISDDGDHVAFCGSFPVEEAIDNARLIAAAPELLEALAGLVGCIDHGSENPTLKLAAARAVIAKARGE